MPVGACPVWRRWRPSHLDPCLQGISSEEAKADSEAQKIRDLYASYMDVAARNKAGIAPIQPLLDQLADVDSRKELTEAFGRSNLDGTISPIGSVISPDRKKPERHLLSVGVVGLGLPDRDFYFNEAQRFQDIRNAYRKHIARMLTLGGFDRADERADAILALETKITSTHWERAQLRDRDKTYNLVSFDQLKRDYSGYDWRRHLLASGIKPPAEVNINTPSSLEPLIKLVNEVPVATWRDYLAFHAIDNHADLLSEEIDQASFAFNGEVLLGLKGQRELWKRAVDQVGGGFALGDAIGKRYVAAHFKPEAKLAMQRLVENLRSALRQNIEKLDWMGEATKAEAFQKHATLNPKIGYPDQWRDYSKLKIVHDDLIKNARALRQFYVDEQNARLKKPTDRNEWRMTPHTVNAYYNPTFNEIVFPAAILQPPFFDLNADPAVNYGAIGAVIGHEMGHGFDDQGSKSDFAGIQRNWWTAEDRERFETRTKALGDQYSKYCPLDGHCVNGQLSMGENIGDLGGLSMAYTAYQVSLNGQAAPELDGLSGDQRFFLAWAQVWKSKYRDEAMINQVRVGPHSPPRYRINGPLRNLNEWYQAFDVKPGDQLYLEPSARVRIW
ncbi:MAG: M13 family metallopeptidase [Ahniella sp.]|nr:M13 family metallopeptidase [Ahniella sp.]